MNTVDRVRNILVTLVPVAICGSACSHEPAFRMERAQAIERDGSAIAVVGDLQQSSGIVRFVRHRENNADAQQQLIADLQAHIDDIAALVIVGDLVFSARSGRDWDHFDSLIAPIAARVPVMPAIGNHDYPCYFVELCRTSVIARGMRDRFPWFVPGEPYAVESGDLLLLFLDSETALAAQGDWLEAQLEDAIGSHAAALIFFHRPPYTNSIDRGAKGDPEVLEHIVPRLEAARLPVVAINGHVHGFEYIVRNDIAYVTTGGGGGPRGPMGDDRPFDRYRGADCEQPDGEVFRPFNYLLINQAAGRLRIDIRGFCRSDAAVHLLDSIEIAL